MNKKITVKNNEGKIRYCILSGDIDFDKQLNLWYFNREFPDMGRAIHFYGSNIEVTDYYVNETLASFEVISIEDTEDEISYAWTEPNTLKTGWL